MKKIIAVSMNQQMNRINFSDSTSVNGCFR